jgi:ferredoxin
MNASCCVVHFPNTNYAPLTLEPHQPLAEQLTVQNSPVLFGCRTGICGTCLVTAIGDLAPPSAAEQEILDMLAPGNSQARLACQIDVMGECAIAPLTEVV